VIQTEIPLSAKPFPSLPKRKGADTPGTSFPVLNNPLDQLKGSSLTQVWRKAALSFTDTTHLQRTTKIFRGGTRGTNRLQPTRTGTPFCLQTLGETATDNKSPHFVLCEKDRSHFSTEYRHQSQ